MKKLFAIALTLRFAAQILFGGTMNSYPVATDVTTNDYFLGQYGIPNSGTFTTQLYPLYALIPFEIQIFTNGSFTANGHFFPNIGTTSGGIMEALTNGAQMLSGAAANNSLGFCNCVDLHLCGGYHFFPNQISISNTFNTDFILEGEGLKSTKLVYTGNQTGIATIQTMASSANSGASLNKPQFIMIRDIGFSAINDTTNWLVGIGDPHGQPSNAGLDGAIIERVNFTGWWAMTNTQNGAELTAGGSGTPPPQGLVGLKINTTQEHGITINNVYCADLACGMDLTCDHLYVRDVAAGNVGFGQGGTNLYSWRTNDPNCAPYAIGALIIDRHQIEASYCNIHCYTAPIGLAFIPQPGSSFTAPATVEGLETEVSIYGVGCTHTETPTIFNPNMSGIYQDCWIISSPDPGALWPSNRYQIVHVVNPASVSYGVDTYNGDGINPLYFVRVGGTNVIEGNQDGSVYIHNQYRLTSTTAFSGGTNINFLTIPLKAGKTYEIKGTFTGFRSNSPSGGLSLYLNYGSSANDCSIPFTELTEHANSSQIGGLADGVNPVTCSAYYNVLTNGFINDTFLLGAGNPGTPVQFVLDSILSVTNAGNLIIAGRCGSTGASPWFLSAGSGVTVTY